MTTYILRRVLLLVPILLLISAIVFFVFRVIPGDAVAIAMGEGADNESAEAMRRRLGLDQPVYVQYAVWLGNVLRGQLGVSLINRQLVVSLVLEKLPATLQLTALSVLLALVIAVMLTLLFASNNRITSAPPNDRRSTTATSWPFFFMPSITLMGVPSSILSFSGESCRGGVPGWWLQRGSSTAA